MNRIPLANRAVALPLLGLLVAWLCFMGATLANLYVPLPQFDANGNAFFKDEIFQVAPYLFLLGIAAVALASLLAQGLAIRARAESNDSSSLARAAQRFSTLGIVLGLAAGAVFAIGSFLGAFNAYAGRADNILLRITTVYLPIILATGLVVYVLLAAFVFRNDDTNNTDGVKRKMSEAQKALGLGYAVPILTTAVAIIIGLGVYDVTRTNLQVWLWVIIIAIVAAGVVFGTRFAAKAKSAKPRAPKTRMALAAGAANLNLVLSIIFGSVVTIMAFAFGSGAISKLQTWSQPPVNCEGVDCNSEASISGLTWTWLIQDLAPAKALLAIAVVGIYVTITERNKEVVSAKKTK
jgi:heme/copper-type cytochrome/quinol oxidase subunit 2